MGPHCAGCSRTRPVSPDSSGAGGSGRQIGAPTPLLATSLPFYEEAVAAGLGDMDGAALCRLLEDKAGFAR